MKISLLLLITLVSFTAAAGESCSLVTLIGERPLSEFAKLAEMPAKQMRAKEKFEQVDLFCPTQSTVSDAFGYTAFISPREGIAYVYQYGGYFGVSDWYGPIPIQPVIAEQCISKQRTNCPITVVVTETK